MKVKLKDLAVGKLEYGSGAAACEYDGETRYVRITDINEEGQLENDIVSPNEYEERHLLCEGDILFARTGATVGKTLCYKKHMGRCVYAGFLIRMVPDTKRVLPEYIYYFTKSPQYDLFIAGNMKVVAQPNINAKQYGDLELELPSLEEQEQVVERLDKVSGLIALRKKQLQKMDELVKVRFVEMFGDPELNPLSWPKVPLGNVITNANNGMARRGNDVEGSIVMRLVELQDGYIDYSAPNRIILNDAEKRRYLLRDNDFLFARVNGNPENVGRCAVFCDIGEPVYHNDHIIRVHFDEALINGAFASALFNSTYGKRQMSSQIKTSAGQYTISQDGIGAIVTILPPLSLQERFAALVEQTDKSKLAIQNGLERLELMKKALMQKYFG